MGVPTQSSTGVSRKVCKDEGSVCEVYFKRYNKNDVLIDTCR